VTLCARLNCRESCTCEGRRRIHSKEEETQVRGLVSVFCVCVSDAGCLVSVCRGSACETAVVCGSPGMPAYFRSVLGLFLHVWYNTTTSMRSRVIIHAYISRILIHPEY
jgi:hypothetical protein